MNDLLRKSLRGGRGGGGGQGRHDEDLESGPHVVQMADMASNNVGADPKFGQFQTDIEAVKAEMEKMKQVLAKLQAANEESKSVHRADAMKALRSRMDADVAAVTKSARTVKVRLEQVEVANAENRKVRGCEEGSAADRLRMTVTNDQRKKLRNLMDQFQGLRAAMAVEYKETIQRRYYTVTGQNADEETIENMIRTGESETFLQKAIREQGRGNVIETIREIQERHDAVKEIEQHLLELHQIFMDISVLVDEQGHKINDIEANVNRANSYTREGVKQLAIAKRHQRSKRKCVCICTILLLIIVLILVLVILGKFGKL